MLPGSHLTPGDLDELREIIEVFGLEPSFLPDLSGSLDGHIPDDFTPTTLGGISIAEIAQLGRPARTRLRSASRCAGGAQAHERTGVPFTVLDRLTGLGPSDDLMALLAQISGTPIPGKYRRQRSQLVDAMLDGHFFFGGKKIAIGAEPDLLWTMAAFLTEMGATSARRSRQRVRRSGARGDRAGRDRRPRDLETAAAGCDLLITHSHGRQLAERLHMPFHRMGFPMFDRLGAAHRVAVGYRGTRDLIFEIGNIFMAAGHEPAPDTWRRTEDAGIGYLAPRVSVQEELVMIPELI